MSPKVKLNKEIDIQVFDEVYTPSEDSYFLLSLIELAGSERVLEIGCGSGMISLHCSARGCDVLSVDKNEKAVRNTKENVEANDLNLRVKKSDLFSSVTQERWDLIIFNPPYLPRDRYLDEDERWDGGKEGDEVVTEFLEKGRFYLEDDGKIYLCYSDLAPEKNIKEKIEAHYEIVENERKEFFFETLHGVCLKLK